MHGRRESTTPTSVATPLMLAFFVSNYKILGQFTGEAVVEDGVGEVVQEALSCFGVFTRELYYLFYASLHVAGSRRGAAEGACGVGREPPDEVHNVFLPQVAH